MNRQIESLTVSPTCYMISRSEHEEEESHAGDAWIDFNFVGASLNFVTASSHEEATEIAESILKNEGYDYDDQMDNWTDGILQITLTVSSMHDTQSWNSPLFERPEYWRERFCAWASENPEIAEKVWKIAQSQSCLGREPRAVFAECFALFEAQQLANTASLPTHSSNSRSKSL